MKKSRNLSDRRYRVDHHPGRSCNTSYDRLLIMLVLLIWMDIQSGLDRTRFEIAGPTVLVKD
jgi:hypothetical protein